MTRPIRSISGDDLEELIKKAEKLPTTPVGTICEMIRLDKKPKPSPRFSESIRIRKGLFVVCTGECKRRGTGCTLGVGHIAGTIFISCRCSPVEGSKKCGQVVKGTGTVEREIGCSVLNLKFERDLLEAAKVKAKDDARRKCREGCKNPELVKVLKTSRTCRDGKVTLKFTGNYECKES